MIVSIGENVLLPIYKNKENGSIIIKRIEIYWDNLGKLDLTEWNGYLILIPKDGDDNEHSIINVTKNS